MPEHYPLPDDEMQPDYPVSVHLDHRMLWVTLYDGRVIGTPLDWYPWLQSLTLADLRDYELTTGGIHWSQHDIDLGIDGMLQGDNPSHRFHQTHGHTR